MISLVFNVAFGAGDVFVSGNLILVMHRTRVASQTGFVLDRVDLLREIKVQSSLKRGPSRMTLCTIVFKHAVNVSHVATFEDVVLAAASLITNPDDAH